MQNVSGFGEYNRIDELIKKVQGMESNAKGSNKECFFIDGYALLKTKSINEQELQQKMKIEKQLKEKGVNIVPTLEYQTDGIDDGFGFKKGYILQEIADGQPLHKSVNVQRMNETELKEVGAEYISTLKALQTERQEFYDKFVSDWIEITKAGLKVDPSKTSNFYYEKGKQINFIDLDVGERFKGNIELETICAEMAVVIADGSKYYNSYFKENPQIMATTNEALSPIFKKLTESFVRQGLDKEQVKQILKGRFPEVNLDEKDGHKLEQTPEVLSQAQVERMQKDKEARERTEQLMEKFRTPKVETSGKLNRTTLKNDMKRNIMVRQIDKSEKEKKEIDFDKKRALFKRTGQGIQLSKRENQLLEEMERQKAQAEEEYNKKQENRKGQGQLH